MLQTPGGLLRTVSVVIPARNEARNIGWVLDGLPDVVDEVIVIDGGSIDDTAQVARLHRADIVVAQQTRRGKGNALALGFELATGDYIVMIDADGSMEPSEIPDFLAALAHGADYAKGSRFRAGGGSDDITALRRAGNWFLNTVTNVLFGSRYSDLCYGYNAFTRECVPVFDLPPTTPGAPRWGDGFEIETMINIRVAVADAKVVEVASYEHERRYGESNLNTFRDGARVLRTIMSERIIAERAAAQPMAQSAALRSRRLPRRGVALPQPLPPSTVTD
jgi:glycosyltransferase involved in cell wall biosynthesis